MAQPFCSMLMEILLFPDLNCYIHPAHEHTHICYSSYMDVAPRKQKLYTMKVASTAQLFTEMLAKTDH